MLGICQPSCSPKDTPSASSTKHSSNPPTPRTCSRAQAKTLVVHGTGAPPTKKYAAQLKGALTPQSHGKVLRRMETRQQGARTDGPNRLTVRPEIYQLFPLATHEDLLNKQALILHFALLGGSISCISHFLEAQVMRRCMLDSLTHNYCVTGRKGKKPMRDLGLLGVVIGAVRTCFKQKAENGEPAIIVQEADVKRAVAEWVRHAPARTKKMEQRASSQE
ncbi:unnamed protein product [Ixodes pacificus]